MSPQMDLHQTDPEIEGHLRDPLEEMMTEEVILDIPQEEDHQEDPCP